MAIAERINYFRNKCGMTMKHLGQRLGYAEKSADVRVAQYESGNRKPKEDTIHALAEIFDVAPAALDVPDIDSYIGIMHTLFVLEDQYDLSADEMRKKNEMILKTQKTLPNCFFTSVRQGRF